MEDESAFPFPLPIVPPKVARNSARSVINTFSASLLNDFFRYPIEKTRKTLRVTVAEAWEKIGQEKALNVFHAAAERVPAYKDFLKKNGINHEKIRSIDDFSQVPLVDKENYLRQYPLEALVWDGELAAAHMTAVSSGSSGTPFMWPRGSLLELEVTYLFELMLSILIEPEKKTLFVNSQAMGMYIGGPFTLNAVLRVAQKGLPLNIVTPGITLEDVVQVTLQLFNSFDQIVIAAYPPFAKDILQVGASQGINWSTKPLKFLLFGEGYSETWRDYVAELAGGVDPHTSLINCFGTADAAILAHETPYTVRLRKNAASKPQLFIPRFGENRLPSVMQYNPALRYLEVVKKELVLTFGSGSIPLVRYNIHDRGGLIPYSHVGETFGKAEESAALGFEKWQLPLVCVFGKSDLTVTLYGLNIYPENIKAALAQPEIRDLVSGRFQMSTETRLRSRNQYLQLYIELNDRVRPTIRTWKRIRNIIVETLKHQNAEYRKLYESMGKRVLPEVKLCRWRDDRYFAVGTKQIWKKKADSRQ